MTDLNLREAPLTFNSSLEEGQAELKHDTLKLLPDAQSLIDRMPDKEKFKNDVSTFFDTLFSVLDDNDDGQIDSKELAPVVNVMLQARMTAVEGHERPRDFFVKRVRENNKGGSALVETFLENVFMKSVWYLGSECRYRKSGSRFVTIIHDGKQLGSLVSLKNNPFVFRLAMSPENARKGPRVGICIFWTLQFKHRYDHRVNIHVFHRTNR